MSKQLVLYRLNAEEVVITTGLTEEQARAICDRPETHGNGWFYGYDEDS